MGLFEEVEVDGLLLGVEFSLLDLEFFGCEGELLGELGGTVGLFEELGLEGMDLEGGLEREFRNEGGGRR